jgi:hypothetical protein
MTFGMPNQRVCSGRLFRYPPNLPTFALKTHDKHLADCGRGTCSSSGGPGSLRSSLRPSPRTAVEGLLEAVAQNQGSKRQTNWVNAISHSSSPPSWLAYVQTSSSRPTSATSAPSTTAPLSSTSKPKAARNVALNPNCCQSSRHTLTAALSVSPALRTVKRITRTPPGHDGLRDSRCSSGAMANASRGERCNHESNETSNAPGHTHSPCLALSFMDCDTAAQPNLPIPT